MLVAPMLQGADSDASSGVILHSLIWLLSQPLFWAALGIFIGPILFFRGFRLLQRKRLILKSGDEEDRRRC